MKAGFVKYLLFCSLIFLCFSTVCPAEPDLDSFMDVKGVRIFRDHAEASKWYITPARPRLARRSDGTPDYGLALYRYLGRRGTSNSGDFWIRGVLTAGVDRIRKSGLTADIRDRLHSAGIKKPDIMTMPVSSSRVSLLFADEQDSRCWAARWRGGMLVLPLGRQHAEILWDAVEAGQTLVSISIEETLAGVRRKEDKWEPSQTSFAWTVPLNLDIASHPGNFQRTDLGARMKFGYTGLDVFCFDFLENLDENLYAKTVEVAIPARGRDLVEEATFKAETGYRSRIRFKLARDLDQPYRYRITKIYKDGSRETGAWQRKTGEAMLDITAYKNKEDAPQEAGND